MATAGPGEMSASVAAAAAAKTNRWFFNKPYSLGMAKALRPGRPRSGTRPFWAQPLAILRGLGIHRPVFQK
jgi:hypothetical protein